MSEIVAIKDMSAGNDTVGEMWQETRIFDSEAPLSAVMDWACPNPGNSRKRVTLTRPDKEA